MKKEIVIDGKTYVLKEETKETTKFKVGDWITDKDKQDFVDILTCVKITSIEGDNIYHSGAYKSMWRDDWSKKEYVYKNCRLATPSEIETHLIAEAKRRYPVGTRFTSVAGLCKNGSVKSWGFSYYNELGITDGNNNYVYHYNTNKWAEIIKEEPIEIGGYEVEFKKGEIKVGCKTIPNKDIKSIEAAVECVLHLGYHITIHEDGDILIGDYEVDNKKFNRIINELQD